MRKQNDPKIQLIEPDRNRIDVQCACALQTHNSNPDYKNKTQNEKAFQMGRYTRYTRASPQNEKMRICKCVTWMPRTRATKCLLECDHFGPRSLTFSSVCLSVSLSLSLKRHCPSPNLASGLARPNGGRRQTVRSHIKVRLDWHEARLEQRIRIRLVGPEELLHPARIRLGSSGCLGRWCVRAAARHTWKKTTTTGWIWRERER